MDPNRKQWNDLHQELHDALAHTETHDQSINLFLSSARDGSHGGYVGGRAVVV